MLWSGAYYHVLWSGAYYHVLWSGAYYPAEGVDPVYFPYSPTSLFFCEIIFTHYFLNNKARKCSAERGPAVGNGGSPAPVIADRQ